MYQISLELILRYDNKSKSCNGDSAFCLRFFTAYLAAESTQAYLGMMGLKQFIYWSYPFEIPIAACRHNFRPL